jgi:hypothetical protein
MPKPPKAKPTWLCHHCMKHFTTKYSLERHWKRFREHASAGMSKREPQVLAPMPETGPTTSTSQLTYHPQPVYYRPPTAAPPPATALTYVPVVEETPRPIKPAPEAATLDQSSTRYLEAQQIPLGADNISHQFPFLPPFLEEEQILGIATPEAPSPTESTTSQNDADEQPSPLSRHFCRIFTTETTGDISSMMSPLTPACTYEKVFSKEEEEKQIAVGHIKPRSPVKLADLDHSLLLGDEEATSPFTFLEKTSQLASDPIVNMPITTNDCLLAGGSSSAAASTSPFQYIQRTNSANVSLSDLDILNPPMYPGFV